MSTAPTPVELRSLAHSANELANAAGDARRRAAAGDEATRRAVDGIGAAVGDLRRAAAALENAASDLARVRARGTCEVDWGLCPVHGPTLVTDSKSTWCSQWGCARRWDYDRRSAPCDQPAAATVTNGGELSRMCTVHATIAQKSATAPVAVTPL